MSAPITMLVTSPPVQRWARRAAIAAAAVPAVLLIGVVMLIALLGAAGTDACAPTGDAAGSLGKVAGTGLTHGQLRSLRASPGATGQFETGSYSATSYGPPWGGLQGPGQATSGGLAIGGGSPRWYMIAVDPRLIGHAERVYIWPNPFRWRGPFIAADTGGAIQGRRIDFYDWRGRTTQTGWGQQTVQVTTTPLDSGGAEPATVAAGGDCGAPVDGGEVGEKIGQLARAHLNAGPSIRGFQPASVSYAWCAWFLTNVWRDAGVEIPVNGWSGYPYQWAQARGQLFKALGQPPKGATPPAGAALMYGSTPTPGGDSRHVNLVDRVLPDGSFMLTGGNQDGGRVTRYGPCRLTRADPARLTGPGCDTRPIYGIAAPTRA